MSTSAETKPVSDQDIWGDGDSSMTDVDNELASKSTEQIQSLARMLENNIRVMKSEVTRISHEHKTLQSKLKENYEKIKLNKQLPYLVSNIVEVGLIIRRRRSKYEY